MKVDLGWWLYLITCIGAWLGFGLFSWWKLKMGGKATVVYQYVRYLFLGIAVMNTGSVYVRWFRIVDPDHYLALVGSWAWDARLWITLIFVWAILLHMSYRVFIQKTYDNGE